MSVPLPQLLHVVAHKLFSCGIFDEEKYAKVLGSAHPEFLGDGAQLLHFRLIKQSFARPMRAAPSVGSTLLATVRKFIGLLLFLFFFFIFIYCSR